LDNRVQKRERVETEKAAGYIKRSGKEGGIGNSLSMTPKGPAETLRCILQLAAGEAPGSKKESGERRSFALLVLNRKSTSRAARIFTETRLQKTCVKKGKG